jgi:hypothetical protein
LRKRVETGALVENQEALDVSVDNNNVQVRGRGTLEGEEEEGGEDDDPDIEGLRGLSSWCAVDLRLASILCV